MNQFFNIQRFAKYAAYDVRTNYKRYLIAAAIAVIVVFVMTYISFEIALLSVLSNTEELNTINWADISPGSLDLIKSLAIKLMTSWIFLYFSFVLLSFPALSGKHSITNYLLLPASVFEKYLLEFLIRIVLGGTLFLFIFHFASNLAINMFELRLNAVFDGFNEWVKIDAFSYSRLWHSFNSSLETPSSIDDLILFMQAFIGLCTLAMAVRLLFKRFAFIKTAIVIIAFCSVFLYIVFNTDRDSMFEHTILDFLWGTLWFLLYVFFSYYLLKKKRV